MDHIELSSEETRNVLNDTACSLLMIDIALSDKANPKFTVMVLKTAKMQLKTTAALVRKMNTAITALLKIITQ